MKTNMQPTPKIAAVVGEKLRALREAGKPMPQSDLAEEIGIPLMVLNRALRGASTPAADALIKIAIYYKTTVDDILGVDEVRKRARKKRPQKNAS